MILPQVYNIKNKYYKIYNAKNKNTMYNDEAFNFNFWPTVYFNKRLVKLYRRTRTNVRKI